MQMPREKYIWIGLGIALLLFLSMTVVVYRSTTGFNANRVSRCPKP